MRNEVYVVEWHPEDYADVNAVFSTAEKAFAYIEKELERMNLEWIHIEPTVISPNDDWFCVDFRMENNLEGYALCTRYEVDAETRE